MNLTALELSRNGPTTKKGRIEFKLEMYDYAVFHLDTVLELNPSSYEAANIIGDIYILKRNRQKAIDYFKKSLAAYDAQPDIPVFVF